MKAAGRCGRLGSLAALKYAVLGLYLLVFLILVGVFILAGKGRARGDGLFVGGHLSRLGWGRLKPASPNRSGVPRPRSCCRCGGIQGVLCLLRGCGTRGGASCSAFSLLLPLGLLRLPGSTATRA